jgi:hypothetical protein
MRAEGRRVNQEPAFSLIHYIYPFLDRLTLVLLLALLHFAIVLSLNCRKVD